MPLRNNIHWLIVSYVFVKSKIIRFSLMTIEFGVCSPNAFNFFL
jgi:hypothetical protein